MSDKVELTEEQAIRIVEVLEGQISLRNSAYIDLISIDFIKIKQNPVEKAKQHISQLYESGIIGITVYTKIIEGFEFLEEKNIGDIK